MAGCSGRRISDGADSVCCWCSYCRWLLQPDCSLCTAAGCHSDASGIYLYDSSTHLFTLWLSRVVVSVIQGHPRSLILAPVESAHATSYWRSIVIVILAGVVLTDGQTDGHTDRQTPEHNEHRAVHSKLCWCHAIIVCNVAGKQWCDILAKCGQGLNYTPEYWGIEIERQRARIEPPQVPRGSGVGRKLSPSPLKKCLLRGLSPYPETLWIPDLEMVYFGALRSTVTYDLQHLFDLNDSDLVFLTSCVNVDRCIAVCTRRWK